MDLWICEGFERDGGLMSLVGYFRLLVCLFDHFSAPPCNPCRWAELLSVFSAAEDNEGLPLKYA